MKKQIAVLEKEIWEMTGQEFNINSPKQLGEILFEKMQIKGGKKTKTGYSTAADVLEKLAPDYPVIQKILDYRQYTKLNSTYADGLGTYIKEDGGSTAASTRRSRRRAVSQHGAEPPEHSDPHGAWTGDPKVFVPRDGFLFLDADYSQIELRVLAHMSGDERLIEAYKTAPGYPRHHGVPGVPYPVKRGDTAAAPQREGRELRDRVRISAFGLSEDLSISRKEAMEYIERYFETYPQVKSFLDSLVAHAKEQGYVTTMLGRRRPVPELKSSNFMQRSFGERVAMNSPIQETAADIIKTP